MHLTDVFMELIIYVVYFQKNVNKKHYNFEQVKADIMRLLTQSEESVRNGTFLHEDYDQARFVICAWVDEIILSSAWEEKNKWQKEQLQRQYYNTADAGEEVFEKLNSLGLHQRDVREVYYLCLTLGFMGRYCHKGDEFLLDQLKTSNLKLLMGSSVGLPSLDNADLFPEAYPVERVERKLQKGRFRFSFTLIAGIAGPILFFGLLLFVFQFALRGDGIHILKNIP